MIRSALTTVVVLGSACSKRGDAPPPTECSEPVVAPPRAAPAPPPEVREPPQPDPPDCGWFVPDSTLELARVRVPAAIYSDFDGCRVEEPRCKKASLRVGDEVIVGPHFGEMACISNGDVSGWTPARDLERVAPAPKGPWAGRWTQGRDWIEIRGRRELAVRGHAEWHGWRDNVHLGDFSGRGTPDAKGTLVIIDDVCDVRFRRLGRYLIVEDNNNCGGVNVRFVGVFVRGPRT